MGNLLKDLQRQAKNDDLRQDAEDCIKVYEWLKQNNGGKVWQSQWTPIVKVSFMGRYPAARKIHTLNFMGKALLRGIENT